MKTIIALTILLSSSLSAEAQFDEAQKLEIQQIIHEYLVTQPEVLKESIQALQQKEQQKGQAKVQTIIFKEAKEVFDGGSPILGNPDGTVNVVEFLDYNCGHCRNSHASTLALIKENPNLRVVIKEYPILGEASRYAAKAALAAQKQGKFAVFHDAMMSSKDKMNNPKVLEIASEVGLDVDELSVQMESLDDKISATRKLALSMGINGTPAFIIAPNPVKDETKIFFVPGAISQETLQDAINLAQ